MFVNQFKPGQVVRLSVEISANGLAVDPVDLALTIKAPDGNLTVETTDLIKDADGFYHYDLALEQAGVYAYRWAGAGDFAGADEGVLRVKKSVLID